MPKLGPRAPETPKPKCGPDRHRWNWDVCVLCGETRPLPSQGALVPVPARLLAVLADSASLDFDAYRRACDEANTLLAGYKKEG